MGLKCFLCLWHACLYKLLAVCAALPSSLVSIDFWKMVGSSWHGYSLKLPRQARKIVWPPATWRALGTLRIGSRPRHPAEALEQRVWESSVRDYVHAYRSQLREGGAVLVLRDLQISFALEYELRSDDQYWKYGVNVEAVASQLPLESAFIVIDAGANLGVRAIEFARRFPRAIIFALEPNPILFGLMLWNLRVNNATGSVWPLNVAVASAESKGRCDMQAGETLDCVAMRPPMRKHRSGQVVEETASQRDESSFLIPAWSLAALLEKLHVGRIAILKLNCEGCEYQVFNDAAVQDMLVRGGIGCVVGEVHDPAGMPPQAVRLVREAMCPRLPADRAGVCSGFGQHAPD